jgi:hypothetical protein
VEWAEKADLKPCAFSPNPKMYAYDFNTSLSSSFYSFV